MNDHDYYKILGVSRSATPQEIRERFRFLSHAYHPDKFPCQSQKSSAESEFKRINEAYSVLSDEIQRCRYDESHSNAQTSSKTTPVPAVLERITYFSPPPYPWSDGPIRQETYDYRQYVTKSPVPPTKIDTLICDLWAVSTNDLGITATSPAQLRGFHVKAAIEIYETRQWSKIRGYRPWTHWNFINKLTAEERAILAEEAHAYMLRNGIKTGDP
jgi:curved DNA-binding protein CbpA